MEFSPLTSRHLPSGAKGLYLGGGYPELYARQLSWNKSLRAEICAAARAGMPVLAECGGFLWFRRMFSVALLIGVLIGFLFAKVPILSTTRFWTVWER